MRTRLILVGLLFVADLLIGPALARLPPYLPLNGSPERLSQWRTQWLEHPIASGLGILNPQTSQDTKARQGWLLLQIAVAVPVLSLLWPLQTGTLTRNGVPVADPSGAHGTARWRSRRAIAESLLRHPIRKPAPPAGMLAGVDSPRWPRQAYLVPGPDAQATTNPHGVGDDHGVRDAGHLGLAQQPQVG